MLHDPEAHRYRWLRVLLGAIVTIAVVSGLVVVIFRWMTYWSPPPVVNVPPARRVTISLENHPRLVATNDAILALSKNPSSPEYLRIMEKADRFYEEYLVDPLQGDTIYPGYFALAWRISGEQRYLDAARDMVLKQCRFPAWKRKPESSNFYKIELAYAVGIAYDLLYDQFSPRERSTIEENLSDVLDGLLWHMQGNPSRAFWCDAPNSNYYVAWHSAAGLMAVCLGDAYHGEWENALAYAYGGLQPSIDLLEKDGGWIEGLTYQDFCWGQHALLFLNSLRVNGGPNVFKEDWYATSVRFALAGIEPSGNSQVDFGDNTSDPIASFGYLWRARSFFDSPFLDQYLASNLPQPDYPRLPLDAILVEAILRFDPTLPLDDFPEPPPCQYFPGIEWVMLRENWTDPDGFFFATKAGYGGWDHNHVDQGSFILAFDGADFIGDPGRGEFDDRKSPEVNNIYAGPMGHSVFCPGTGNSACFWDDFTMYSENARYRQADAKIVDWVDTPDHTSFEMVLDGAYPSEGLARWRRSFLWNKPGAELPGGAVTILDDADVPGTLRFTTSMPMSDRTAAGALREGRVLSRDHAELGIWSWGSGKEGEYALGPLNRDGLSTLSVTGTSGEGLTRFLTVLLPRDEIAHVVVEANTQAEPVSVFVDGFLVEFRLDESGNWRYMQ